MEEQEGYKKISPRYMMATKAMHQLGDISRKTPSLCIVSAEDSKNFIGSWVDGFGFFDVHFPKETTKELEKKDLEKSPVITLPEDEGRRKQLEAKLEEYKKRINPSIHPALQMGAICKKTILERLLKNGKICTWEIAEEMVKEYGTGFNSERFNNACGVIEDYCTTGGANTCGGTGLLNIH